jgi:hypothetical protein
MDGRHTALEKGTARRVVPPLTQIRLLIIDDFALQTDGSHPDRRREHLRLKHQHRVPAFGIDNSRTPSG